MKSLLISFALLCYSCMLSGQSSAIISGKVLSPRQPFMVLYYERDLGFKNVIDTIRLDAENKFNYRWNFDPSNVIGRLAINPTSSLSLWAVDKGDIQLEIADTVSQSRFGGSLGSYAQFLAENRNVEKQIRQKFEGRNPGIKFSDSSDNRQYYLLEDSILNERLGVAKTFFSATKDPVAQEFLALYNNMLSVAVLETKTTSQYDAILRFKPFQEKFNYTNASWSFEQPAQFDFADGNFYKLSNMQYFLRNYLFHSNFAWKQLRGVKDKWNWDSVYANIFRVIDKMEEPGSYGNSFIKAAFMNLEVKLMHTTPYKEDTTEQIYQKYVDEVLQGHPALSVQYAHLTKTLREKLNSLGKLKKGMPAPVVALIDEKGNEVGWKEVINTNIYIDIWASWCAPCIAEMPNWNKLAKKYEADKRIDFITISVDDDPEKWKAALKKYKPGGKHYLAKGGWESDFSRTFSIKGVPRNMLIDAKANMLQQTAESASQIDLDKILEGLR